MRAGQWLLAGGLGLLLYGCGSSGGQGPTTSIDEMLTKVQAAPKFVAHHGVRRVEHYYLIEDQQQSVSYRERVWNDGQGRFALETTHVFSSGGMDFAQFAMLQNQRAGFSYRYRDFQVRDLNLFASNYQLQNLGGLGTVAGRVTWDLEISRKTGSKRVYRISFDLETGLVLACIESSFETGDIFSRMWYESIDMAPDFSGVVWHEPSNSETPIDLDGDLFQQLGFNPYKPQLLPPGYQFDEASQVVDDKGRAWLKITYTDGVEPAFFLHGAPELDLTGSGSGTAAAGGFSTGNDSSEPAVMPGSAVFFRAGSLTVVQGDLHGQDLIAVGKELPDDLFMLLQSALP